jgi:hypothetical protein
MKTLHLELSKKYLSYHCCYCKSSNRLQEKNADIQQVFGELQGIFILSLKSNSWYSGSFAGRTFVWSMIIVWYKESFQDMIIHDIIALVIWYDDMTLHITSKKCITHDIICSGPQAGDQIIKFIQDIIFDNTNTDIDVSLSGDTGFLVWI